MHYALKRLASEVLPAYEPDDGELTPEQFGRDPAGRTPRPGALGLFQPLLMPARWWSAPAAGDIVWCHFPRDRVPTPGPKLRPATAQVVASPVTPSAQPKTSIPRRSATGRASGRTIGEMTSLRVAVRPWRRW